MTPNPTRTPWPAEQELDFTRDGLTIRGELHVPESLRSEATFPVVILSHGFGGSRRQFTGYISTLLDAGFAAYAFDFCGGGPSSDSDGATTDMSVLTEKADLEAVLQGIRSQPFTDTNRVYLFGASQGGFVSAITAAAHPDEVAAMVLFYPAFVIPDDARAAFPDPQTVPDTYTIMGMTVGRVYYEDALKSDVWNVIGNYSGDVLIEHGTADPIVPYSYSERALGVYNATRDHATLIPIEGAGHGFSGSDDVTAVANAMEFLRGHV